MPIIKLVGLIGMLGLMQQTLASPPFQILQTCINDKPYNNKIVITRLPHLGAPDKTLSECEDQYNFTFKESSYGFLTCKDKFYLIINDKKIDPARADNRSVNPEIQPGNNLTPRALWYKIDYKNKEYLCILAPLAEQGKGSAYNQYYIVENAFDKNLDPELYYYFLDKNIAPISSKTL